MGVPNAYLYRIYDFPGGGVILLCLRTSKFWAKFGGPPRGFGEQGKKGIYFRGTGEQRPNFEGNRGTKTILGNREHKKTNFRFLGNRGASQFISGEQVTLGVPQYCIRSKFVVRSESSTHNKLFL